METSLWSAGSVAFLVNRPYRWAPRSRVRRSVAMRTPSHPTSCSPETYGSKT
jgi:hypothetical protein